MDDYTRQKRREEVRALLNGRPHIYDEDLDFIIDMDDSNVENGGTTIFESSTTKRNEWDQVKDWLDSGNDSFQNLEDEGNKAIENAGNYINDFGKTAYKAYRTDKMMNDQFVHQDQDINGIPELNYLKEADRDQGFRNKQSLYQSDSPDILNKMNEYSNATYAEKQALDHGYHTDFLNRERELEKRSTEINNIKFNNPNFEKTTSGQVAAELGHMGADIGLLPYSLSTTGHIPNAGRIYQEKFDQGIKQGMDINEAHQKATTNAGWAPSNALHAPGPNFVTGATKIGGVMANKAYGAVKPHIDEIGEQANRWAGRAIDDINDWAEDKWDDALNSDLARKYGLKKAAKQISKGLDNASDYIEDKVEEFGDRLGQIGKKKGVRGLGNTWQNIYTEYAPYVGSSVKEIGSSLGEDKIGQIADDALAMSQGYDVDMMRNLTENGVGITPQLLTNTAIGVGLDQLSKKLSDATDIVPTNTTGSVTTPLRNVMPNDYRQRNKIMQSFQDNPTHISTVNNILKYPNGDQMLKQFFDNVH